MKRAASCTYEPPSEELSGGEIDYRNWEAAADLDIAGHARNFQLLDRARFFFGRALRRRWFTQRARSDDDERQKRREAGFKSAASSGKEGVRAAALKGLAKLTPEQLSEAARKGRETRRRSVVRRPKNLRPAS
jgi:hypothetical protein